MRTPFRRGRISTSIAGATEFSTQVTFPNTNDLYRVTRLRIVFNCILWIRFLYGVSVQTHLYLNRHRMRSYLDWVAVGFVVLSSVGAHPRAKRMAPTDERMIEAGTIP